MERRDGLDHQLIGARSGAHFNDITERAGVEMTFHTRKRN
jgi:hypothetical protein